MTPESSSLIRGWIVGRIVRRLRRRPTPEQWARIATGGSVKWK